MTGHDPHDETVEMFTEGHARPAVAQSSDPARGWKRGIPSVASLLCGLFPPLAVFIVITQVGPIRDDAAVAAARIFAGLGVMAVLLGAVGVFIARGIWFRLMAIVGILAGGIIAWHGFVCLLFFRAMS